MLKSHLKTAVRSLLRHKTFSLINILGFAFSISICMMIILFVMKEHSYDRFYMNSDNIYKLVDSENNSSGIDYRLKTTIVNNFPEIKSGSITRIGYSKMGISYNHNNYTLDNCMSVDNDYFKVFSIPILSGNTSRPLQNINSVVLTKSSAYKIFGNKNPVGKTITIEAETPLTITAVIKDYPDNSSINAGMLISSENTKFNNRFTWYGSDSSTYRYPACIYLLFKNDANVNLFVQNINKHAEILNPYVKKVGLLPLKDVYLHDNTEASDTKKGNPSLLELMTGIALIILILAIVNYVNLAVAQQNRRNKETGIRKTIGAGREDIIKLYLTESVLVTFIAFIIALLMVEISLPYFSKIVDSNLSIRPFWEFPANLISVFSILLIGIVSGFGPALLISSFNPVRIFSGNTFISNRKGYPRNFLTVFQFTVSIALIFCILVIQKQIDFVKHRDLGFDKEQLLRFYAPFNKVTALTNEFRQYSNITGVSASCGVPGEINMQLGGAVEGKDQPVSCIMADSSFLQTFKIQLLTGRKLLPGEYGKVCMINETAYKYFGWKDINNKRFNSGREGGFEVIGVVKDFHFSSLHNVIEPACIMFSSGALPNIISLRIKPGTLHTTINYLHKVWKESVPNQEMEYHFYDDLFNEMYVKEDRFAEAIGLFAVLAISISCLGILGLVIFASERRSKEIGIRKVHGAKVSELMFMLNKDFLKWVVFASVIALPLGWFAMNKWLADFAYKTDINWWVFALAVLIALLIAFMTVTWQTWRTVKKNPVEVLRYQ
jgi:putative ABC transport system permease protein